MDSIDGLKSKLKLLGYSIVLEGKNGILTLQEDNTFIRYFKDSETNQIKEVAYKRIAYGTGESLIDEDISPSQRLQNSYYIAYRDFSYSTISEVLDKDLNIAAAFFMKIARRIILNKYIILKDNNSLGLASLQGSLIDNIDTYLDIYVLDNNTLYIAYDRVEINKTIVAMIQGNKLTTLCSFDRSILKLAFISYDTIAVQKEKNVLLYDLHGRLKLVVKEASIKSEKLSSLTKNIIQDRYGTQIKSISALENLKFYA